MSITPISAYGIAKFIVSTTAGQGNYTTLAGAMAAASSGDTIFLRSSVTENVTITPGVNIASWYGSSLNSPTITGKLSMTGAGTSFISGVTLATNSDFAIAVTGSAASILNINNCYINCSNNTGISYTSSSGSSEVNVTRCYGNIGTTGISLFSASGSGTISFEYCRVKNSGAATTASTASAGTLNVKHCLFDFPITTSSTAAISSLFNNFSTDATNTTAFTAGGSGAQVSQFDRFTSGSASAISISQTLTLSHATVDSSNTNVLTGSGTVKYSFITFSGSSAGHNVTTETAQSTLI